MEGCPALSQPSSRQLRQSPSAAPPAPARQPRSGAQGRSGAVGWATWTDCGKSQGLANASFAISDPVHTHSCLCGCGFWLVGCPLPITPQDLSVARVGTAGTAEPHSWPQLAMAPVWFVTWTQRWNPVLSQAKKPQTKGESESQWGRLSGRKGAGCTGPWLPKARFTKSNGQLPPKEQFSFALSRESPVCLKHL